MTDSVSVIIPAFNGAGYSPRAIESILDQTLPVHEIFVVDDGSSDDTAAVAERYGPAVRVVRQKNGGPGSARNHGARLATGSWLAFLDADDWWFRQKNELELRCASDSSIGLVHCLFDHRPDRPPAELTFDDVWEQNWIGNSSVMIRRQIFEAVGRFSEDRAIISTEDHNLWLRVAAAGHRIVTCPYILAHYSLGIGISSNPERLMAASLANIDDVQRRLGLPDDMVAAKRASIIDDFGRQAFHARKLPEARKALLPRVRAHPSVQGAARLLATYLPPAVLDIKQNLRGWVSSNLVAGDAAALAIRERHAPAIPVDEIPFWRTEPKVACILDRRFHVPVSQAALPRPIIITTIDAEEDFDWNGPFERDAAKVTSMRAQHRAHAVFERHGVIPTYLVDYPIVSQDAGRAPLRELIASGVCDVGSQLHPWVNPPFLEELATRNSYPGNLPLVVEYEKLKVLTEAVTDAFGVQPHSYRAGRCGVGPNTGEILKRLGYEIDTSVMPFWNYVGEGGTNFDGLGPEPYWADQDRSLLELPIGVALVGLLTAIRRRISGNAFEGLNKRLGVTSVFARLGLLNRVRLSPEGISIAEAKHLVRHGVAAGNRVFVLTYHSPSLEPGNTPYVRSSQDLARFLGWLDEFYDFFRSEVGGIPATLSQAREWLRGDAAPVTLN